ncbi:MAG: 30S ribosomal protein S17 [Candidatus Calescibacterium sp.]|nr:30S ribosomal protein S17 [Candidatus Calescibacterium sp.]MCX7972709.1 30S ribosomal protein S17 [bacterium]MDW8195513.1 30S ribosomal protein S17 [Candidatus Calescibacterium sp.]
MRKNRKKLVGIVVSDKMEKTVVVKVERNKIHPKYKKVVKTFKKYYAHNEDNEAKEGDKVMIMESRPLSKLKRWVVIKIIERAQKL